MPIPFLLVWFLPSRMDDEVTFAIIGAAMQVHRELGPGLREVCYQRALAAELGFRKIAFQREAPIPLSYRGADLGTFRADFRCRNSVLLELKAMPFIPEQAVL
jgi:GxxExxY protein